MAAVAAGVVDGFLERHGEYSRWNTGIQTSFFKDRISTTKKSYIEEKKVQSSREHSLYTTLLQTNTQHFKS
jgi:hypothetical protein